LRQPILYAVEMWRRQRLWLLMLVAIGVVAAGFSFWQRRSLGDTNTLIFLAYIPVAILVAGLMYYYRWRSNIQLADEGLRVSNLLGSIVIPYDCVRWAKVYPLQNHFNSNQRKRLVRPVSRPLMDKPALFVRFSGDDELMARVRKKLGRTYVDDDVLALPLPDPDAFSWELAGHLPTRVVANQGGQRRSKRRRRR
jgi:hypothetical protein